MSSGIHNTETYSTTEEKICTPLAINLVFTLEHTLRWTLMKVKSQLPEERKEGVVYKTTCSNCNQVYTSEAKGIMKVHMDEHIQKTGPNKGIAVHVVKS